MLRWDGEPDRDVDVDPVGSEALRLGLLRRQAPFLWFCRLVPTMREGRAIILLQTMGGEALPVDRSVVDVLNETRPHLSGELPVRFGVIHESSLPWGAETEPVELLKVAVEAGSTMDPAARTVIRCDWGWQGDDPLWVTCPVQPRGLPR